MFLVLVIIFLSWHRPWNQARRATEALDATRDSWESSFVTADERSSCCRLKRAMQWRARDLMDWPKKKVWWIHLAWSLGSKTQSWASALGFCRTSNDIMPHNSWILLKHGTGRKMSSYVIDSLFTSMHLRMSLAGQKSKTTQQTKLWLRWPILEWKQVVWRFPQ